MVHLAPFPHCVDAPAHREMYFLKQCLSVCPFGKCVRCDKTEERSVKILANVNSRSRSLYAIVRPSVCDLSVVCLSVVCNVRAPYSGDWNFRQCFYAIWYLGHLWTFDKNFTAIVPEGPLRRGVKPKRDSQISILDLSKAISRKRCKIAGKLLFITNSKSHMSFRLVPKSVTSNDLERRNSPNLCVLSPNSPIWGQIT